MGVIGGLIISMSDDDFHYKLVWFFLVVVTVVVVVWSLVGLRAPRFFNDYFGLASVLLGSFVVCCFGPFASTFLVLVFVVFVTLSCTLSFLVVIVSGPG